MLTDLGFVWKKLKADIGKQAKKWKGSGSYLNKGIEKRSGGSEILYSFPCLGGTRMSVKTK